MLAQGVKRPVFHALEQIRVTAAFTELHHDIQYRCPVLPRLLTSDAVQISQEQLLVKLNYILSALRDRLWEKESGTKSYGTANLQCSFNFKIWSFSR